MEFMMIVYGLVSVMIANILLGTNIANMNKEFTFSKFIKGIVKSIFIVVSCCLLYLCSYLNPDLIVADINGVSVNLIDGMELLFVSEIISYGYQCLAKLKCILSMKC